jgi:hypothetical protein
MAYDPRAASSCAFPELAEWPSARATRPVARRSHIGWHLASSEVPGRFLEAFTRTRSLTSGASRTCEGSSEPDTNAYRVNVKVASPGHEVTSHSREVASPRRDLGSVTTTRQVGAAEHAQALPNGTHANGQRVHETARGLVHTYAFENRRDDRRRGIAQDSAPFGAKELCADMTSARGGRRHFRPGPSSPRRFPCVRQGSERGPN